MFLLKYNQENKKELTKMLKPETIKALLFDGLVSAVQDAEWMDW